MKHLKWLIGVMSVESLSKIYLILPLWISWYVYGVWHSLYFEFQCYQQTSIQTKRCIYHVIAGSLFM